MKNLFIFLAGAAVGSLVTWKILDRKYAELADKEIESVIETFNKEKDKMLDQYHEIEKNTKEELNKLYYDKKVKDLGYVSNPGNVIIGEKGTSNDPKGDLDEEDDQSDYISVTDVSNGSAEKFEEVKIPYVIDENAFGEFGNEEKTLMYFDDGILSDDDGDIITDPESEIGDALEEFSNPLCERVYVRDEEKEIDYIILRSEKTYKEVYGEEE